MTDPVDTPRAWLGRALVALLLPPLLVAPVVFLLHRQAQAIDAAEHAVDDALERAQADVAAIQGIHRARAELLARKVVFEVVQESRPDVVGLLNVLGALPAGVRLDSIRMVGTEVYLDGTAALGDAGVVAALEAGGLSLVKLDAAAPGRFALVAEFGTLPATPRTSSP